jgi:hypothetical protein
MEVKPAMETYLMRRDRRELEGAVDLVDRELMSDEMIGDEQFVVPASRATAWNSRQLRARDRKRIERLSSSAPAQEESPEEPRAGEGKQPGVDAGAYVLTIVLERMKSAGKYAEFGEILGALCNRSLGVKSVVLKMLDDPAVRSLVKAIDDRGTEYRLLKFLKSAAGVDVALALELAESCPLLGWGSIVEAAEILHEACHHAKLLLDIC